LKETNPRFDETDWREIFHKRPYLPFFVDADQNVEMSPRRHRRLLPGTLFPG
jgi:hypothetical protein